MGIYKHTKQFYHRDKNPDGRLYSVELLDDTFETTSSRVLPDAIGCGLVTEVWLKETWLPGYHNPNTGVFTLTLPPNTSALTIVKPLDAQQYIGLTGIELEHQLEGLFIFDLPIFKDISRVPVNNLKRLNLHNTGVSDISVLGGAHELYWLDLTLTNVSDFSPIRKLKNLRAVAVSRYHKNNKLRLDSNPDLKALGKIVRFVD